MLRPLVVVLALVVVASTAACSTVTSAHAPPHDASGDAWLDSGVPLSIGVRVGGSGGDRDAGTTPPGCSARLLVVFDRSLSMGELWSGGGTSGPRWQIAETALADAVRAHAAQLSVGAILFPSRASGSGPFGACEPVDPLAAQMPFQRGPAFLATWSAFWGTNRLLGATPIDAAFDAADGALGSARDETAVVLLTDGEPTCSGSVPAAERAATWRARGVRTWVVGLPGSDAGMAYLAAIASAGGTDAPLSPTDPAALATGLAAIAHDQVASQCPP